MVRWNVEHLIISEFPQEIRLTSPIPRIPADLLANRTPNLSNQTTVLAFGTRKQ